MKATAVKPKPKPTLRSASGGIGDKFEERGGESSPDGSDEVHEEGRFHSREEEVNETLLSPSALSGKARDGAMLTELKRLETERAERRAKAAGDKARRGDVLAAHPGMDPNDVQVLGQGLHTSI